MICFIVRADGKLRPTEPPPADPRYLLPGDFRMARFHLLCEMPAHLRNDLDAARDKPLPLPIGFERLDIFS